MAGESCLSEVILLDAYGCFTTFVTHTATVSLSISVPLETLHDHVEKYVCVLGKEDYEPVATVIQCR